MSYPQLLQQCPFKLVQAMSMLSLPCKRKQQGEFRAASPPIVVVTEPLLTSSHNWVPALTSPRVHSFSSPSLADVSSWGTCGEEAAVTVGP